MKNEEMARLFSEATPYIQKYHGRTMVIKYGGNAMINEDLKDSVKYYLDSAGNYRVPKRRIEDVVKYL